MRAVRAIEKLERMGYRFRVIGNSIHYKFTSDDPPDASGVRPLLEEVKTHKSEALVWLMEQSETCPTCGQKLNVTETDRCREVQCPAEPVHFYRLENKRPGQPMGYYTDYAPKGACRECSQPGETYSGRCARCLRAFTEARVER